VFAVVLHFLKFVQGREESAISCCDCIDLTGGGQFVAAREECFSECGAGIFACRRLSGGALVAAMLLGGAGGFACLARFAGVFFHSFSARGFFGIH